MRIFESVYGMRAHAPTSLLHAYHLQRGKCRLVPAQTHAHPDGELRITPENLQRLRDSSDRLNSAPVIALFSTGHSNEPVALQSYETLWVKIKKGARVKSKRGLPQEPKNSHNAENTDDADWQPMVVNASHAYVRGMRVSGIIHRAVVRLVRYA